ncbi:MAG: DPP IV N-terminal domain-containing protein [Tannerellaceae bacterium]
MRRTINLLLVACAMAAPIMMTAQQKQLTLHDLTPGGKTYSNFIPANLKQLQWCAESYFYLSGDSIVVAHPDKSGCVSVTLPMLNAALADAGLMVLKSLPSFSAPYADQPVLAFTKDNHRIHYNYQLQTVTAQYTLPEAGSNYDFCPDNNTLAFTEGNNVKILHPSGKAPITVTSETEAGIVCGQAVHQREFGIHKGTFWSPKGSALAFYRMDERMVTDYPIVNIDTRTAQVEPFKYPMAGMKSHEVTIGVYQPTTGNTVWLQTGLPKEKYLTNIAWSPDEKSIYIAEVNRAQNESRLVRYNVLTGKQEAELFIETDSRYVEPRHAPLFLPGKPDQFIWQSERDGYNHLYLYNTDGTLLRQLTSGEWVVTEVQGFDKKGENLFITATAPYPLSSFSYGTPMEIYGWKVNLKTGKRTCLTQKTGVHSLSLSPAGDYAIDRSASPTRPRDIDLIRTKDAKAVATLLSATNPYEGYAMPQVETGKLKAADGVTDLNCRLVKPLGLDENKKYPVIIYVYGGPHAQLITGGWMNGVGGWDLYMAQRGYVVFTVDSRGSANRGHAFESVIHRHLGVNEMADQMEGVNFLKTLPYVDASRIGVFGWSYGGFMATNLMLTHPDVFKTGVAGGPVIDWSKYEIMYGERYMDTPDENPEGYKAANLKEKAANLKGHLLLIHGTSDPIVVWQHSLGFLKACVAADTYPDYFVYPGHQHNVIGKDRPHLYEKITRYFDDYLK